MTDIRLTFTINSWIRVGATDTKIVWVRSPVSVIREVPEEWQGESCGLNRLLVTTVDGQEVRCDDTIENRKALGLVEAGSPPSIHVPFGRRINDDREQG